MTITIHRDIMQNTPEWHDIRRGIVTASETSRLLTPAKLEPSKQARSYALELIAAKLTGRDEGGYSNDDMDRGHIEEQEARRVYTDAYEEAEQVGFVTNDSRGYVVGLSPDALVGERGMWECKSHKPSLHVDHITAVLGGIAELGVVDLSAIDQAHMLQMQAAMLIAERDWCDYSAVCLGLPMMTVRIRPDKRMQSAIVVAWDRFHEMLATMESRYRDIIADVVGADDRLVPTERIELEMT